MKRKYFVLALFLAALTIFHSESAEATALGLADGVYNISLDFPTNPILNGSGTLTIGPPAVSAFHIMLNGVNFDCQGCDLGFDSTSGDLLLSNTPQIFAIRDSHVKITDLVFDPSGVRLSIIDGPIDFGTWTVIHSQVPEPQGVLLLTLGISVLGLRLHIRRRK